MTRHLSQDERRRQILDAARRSFVSSGYEHSRMSDIARAAGLSKGGVYFHFSSKREIFDALVDGEFDLAMETLERITASEGPASIKLGRLATYYLQRFASEADVTRFPLVVGEMSIRDDDLRARLLTLHQRFLDGLAMLVEAGVEQGEFRDVDPRTAALLLKALVDGIERQYTLGNDFDLEALVLTGLDIVMMGLAPVTEPRN